MNLKALVLFVALSSMTATAAPLITSTISNDAPVNAYISNTVGTTTTIQWKNQNTTEGPRNVGQTFKLTESISFSGITFQVLQNRDGSYNSEFRFEVFAFANESTFTPSGPTIYEATGTLPSVAFTDKQYLTFALPESINLSPGQYGIQLSLVNSRSRNDVNFYTATGSSYSNGIGFLSTATGPDGSLVYAALGGSGGADLNFFLHAEAIPEPTSAGLILLLLGAGAVKALPYRRFFL